jgi:hypothetical protein
VTSLSQLNESLIDQPLAGRALDPRERQLVFAPQLQVVEQLVGSLTGSLGIRIRTGDLFCGDLLTNTRKPVQNSMVEAAADEQASVARLKQQFEVATIYPGHGEPFPLAQLPGLERRARRARHVCAAGAAPDLVLERLPVAADARDQSDRRSFRRFLRIGRLIQVEVGPALAPGLRTIHTRSCCPGWLQAAVEHGGSESYCAGCYV